MFIGSGQAERVAQIERAVIATAFGGPILMNVFRAIVVEVIVAAALDRTWRHCSADFYAWDFERHDGVRLELRQSAARQTWTTASARPSNSVYDIRERSGRHGDDGWIVEQRRWADIYVFAHHPGTDSATDHRDPLQWNFYVCPTKSLPDQKSISLGRLRQFARLAKFETLNEAVAEASKI